MKTIIRTIAITAILIAGSCSAHAAAPYPAKPVSLVVGFPPGGGADQVARIFANALSTELATPVIVENRPGAGSTIAASSVARSNADGYTLYLGNASVMGSDSALYKVDYKPDDFIPVAQLTLSPLVLITNSQLGLNNVQQLIDRAKKQPGAINVASSGNGIVTHLAAVEFMKLTGVNLMHIPFKGGVAAVQSVAAGDTDISFATASSARAAIESGKVTALAVTSADASPLMPYPPIANTVSGYELTNWWGIFVPKDTPPNVLKILFHASNVVLANSEVQQSLAASFEQVTPSGSLEEFSNFARSEGKKGLRLATESMATAN
ncbi:hypothetical protein LMG1861_01881 [Achromobacter piechaudii]|uniref:Uncharacterized protein n=1 Tax=Achromobacter piechaudii TaxID=72556 RepID=A0A6S7CM58_9BURK|nr:hypothetical protein LMG1861_01881 [Achromobacter piechaudii]